MIMATASISGSAIMRMRIVVETNQPSAGPIQVDWNHSVI
jgi:hypothetical protein